MSVIQQLHPGLLRRVKEKGWPDLSPIQKAAFQPLWNGQDCVIEAPTAGGKTEAVLFPVLTRVAQRVRDSAQVLYIAPLRAVLNDLEERASEYAGCCGLSAFKWHGDVSQASKVQQFRTPPNLLLTTPESLEAILLRKAGWREFFSGLETIVIDEAHSFALGDRGTHLVALLERIETAAQQHVQRIALSATLGNPEELARWLVGARAPAMRIAVPEVGSKHADYLLRYFDDSLDSEETPSEHRASWRFLRALTDEIRGAPGERRRSVAFVSSRSNAEALAKAVAQFTRGRLRVQTHHSAVSKYFREDAERLIRLKNEDGIDAIISTSTLELGIDIGALDAVLQIGALSSSSSFLQRVGRTGRRPGKPAYFRGFTQDPEDLLLSTAAVSLGMDRRSESIRFPRKPYHLLAHQLLCLALQEHGVAAERVWEILRRTHSYAGITQVGFAELAAYMCREQYLRRADGVLVIGEAAEQRYLASNWRKLFAVFDSAPLYDVLQGKTQVGTLDTAFVDSLAPPFFFILAGRLWKAEKVDHDRRVVKAEAAAAGSPPKWKTFGGPDVPFETAQRAGEFIYGKCQVPNVLDSTARAALDALRVDHGAPHWSTGEITVLTGGGGQAVLVTYAGDAINRSLARLLERENLRVNGDYASLTVKDGPENKNDMLDLIRKLIGRFAGDDTATLEESLVARQPVYYFSPFSPMLPERLAREALADATTDLLGLQRLLKEQRLRAI